MSLSMRNLEQCFENAIYTNALFIGVKIETQGSLEAEIIINPRKNFEFKLAYYKKAYDENLVLKTFSGIRIVGITFGDCFDDIECDFENINESYRDEVGGVHDCGVAWNPNGVFCGECASESCKGCYNEFTKKEININ